MCDKEIYQKIKVIDTGRKSYKETWELQKKIHEKRVRDEIPDTLILTQPNHVITLGRSAKKENLLFEEEFLKKKGIDIFKVERGGDVTYHGPGQLVGYPIFKIKGITKIKKFVENIEESIIYALKKFKISAAKDEKHPGVWVGNDKICAIGIAVKKGVSFHGFALNINPSLSYFNLIIPCGIKEKGVTSLEKILKKKINYEKVKKTVVEGFGEIFKKEIEWERF